MEWTRSREAVRDDKGSCLVAVRSGCPSITVVSSDQNTGKPVAIEDGLTDLSQGENNPDLAFSLAPALLLQAPFVGPNQG